MSIRIIKVTLFLITLLPLTLFATDFPEGYYDLSRSQQGLAERIMASEYPYDCCDSTILRCLDMETQCSLPDRLAWQIINEIHLGRDEAQIRRAIELRGLSMLSTSYEDDIEVEGFPVAGDQNAPVNIVAYTCLRCPFCSRIVPLIYNAVTEGILSGKANFIAKPFPLNSHEHSTEGAIAYMAAVHLGKGFEYLLYAYENYGSFNDEQDFETYAKDIGISISTFQSIMQDSDIRSQVENSKREGYFIGVEATPTFFINGKLYQTSHNYETLVDVIEEEYESVR